MLICQNRTLLFLQFFKEHFTLRTRMRDTFDTLNDEELYSTERLHDRSRDGQNTFRMSHEIIEKYIQQRNERSQE